MKSGIDFNITRLLDDKEFSLTWKYHGAIHGKAATRKFNFECIYNLINRNDPLYKEIHLMMYGDILHFLNDFLTEDAKDPEKVCDERILTFFAYSYYKLEFSYREDFYDLYDIIIDLGEYDPVVFNSKKYPDLKEKVDKFIEDSYNKCLPSFDQDGKLIPEESMYKVRNPWMIEK